MAYFAAAVANEFLDRAATDRVELTQISIQKLVYFAQGWNLAWTQKPLILELIEAWEYGPVVRSLYNQFRRFGSAKITEKALDFSVNTLGETVTNAPLLGDALSRNVVGAVWQQYGHLQPFKLVEMTHAVNSPWEEAYRNKRRIIDNDVIRDYFTKLLRTAA